MSTYDHSVQYDKLLQTFFSYKIPKSCDLFTIRQIYFYYKYMNINLFLLLSLPLLNLSLQHISTFLSIEILLKIAVCVCMYLSSEGLVCPIVHHAGMWEVQSPEGRSLVCSGLQQLHRSWRLLGNVGQTGAHHSPQSLDLNSSPLKKRWEDTFRTFLYSSLR